MKTGDVIQLKGGSNRMTVEGFDMHTQQVRVVWFDEKKKIQRDRFPLDAVESAPEPLVVQWRLSPAAAAL